MEKRGTTWEGKVPVLVIGGGMISQEVILPTIFQERKRGKVGPISISTLTKGQTNLVREMFPEEEFRGYPNDPGAGEDEPRPESYKQAIADLEEHGVVIVATPDHLHQIMIMDALAAGRDIICEKPLCLKAADAHRIMEASREKGVYVLTDYHKRHDRAVRAAKRKYNLGELGEMLHGHAWIEEKRDMPLKAFAAWAQHSSPFEYIGVHYSDAYYFITGLKPKRLIAFGQKKFLPKHGKDAFDAIQATIEWEDGSVLFIQTSWVCSDYSSSLTNQGLQLSGTEGEYWADHKARGLHFVTQAHGYEDWNPNFFKAYDSWDEQGEAEYVGYGYDSIVQGIDDVRELELATLGMSKGEAVEFRKKRFMELEKSRALPVQALVGTAINEAVRLSIDNGNALVGFDEEMYPRVLKQGE
jgi:predicted dehydrogenase